MALKFLDIFSRTDAKSRIIIVVLTVGVVIGVIYAMSQYLGTGGPASGHASVANAPTDLQSVPGGQLTPEYSRALAAENAQVAQKAQSSGGSAVATLVNTEDQNPSTPATGANCTVVCPSSETADVTNDITNLVKSGKLTQAEASTLLDAAKNNVPVTQYAASLAELVKQGKITPEQARKMLDTYTKQHDNTSVAAGAQAMDTLIKSGKLPLEVANHLLDMQKQNVTPAQYSDELNREVKEGKITPEVAAQLLAQYTQQKASAATQDSISSLQQMAKSGQISQEAAEDLTKMQQRGVSATKYQAELDKLVAEGKMTPATAAKLLADYKTSKGSVGPAAMLTELTKSPDDVASQGVTDLVAAGKISPETATALTNLQTQHVSPQEYQKQLDALVASGKISPDDAKKLMADYVTSDAGTLGSLISSGKITPETANVLADMQKRKVSPAEYQQQLNELVKEGKISPAVAKSLMMRYQNTEGQRTEAEKLMAMQANNATPAEYTAELARAVKAGLITPEMATELEQQYRAATTAVAIVPPSGTTSGIDTNLPGNDNFAKLQQRLREHQAEQAAQPIAAAAPTTLQQSVVDNSQQYADAAAQAAAQAAAAAAQARTQRIQGLVSAMSGQAHALISAWQPVAMSHKGNSAPGDNKDANGKDGKTTTTTTTTTTGTSGPPVIKAGTIYFAILDTGVNSDYPDTPVMATIVDGPWKGAKLLGKVAVSANSTTQSQDRVSLTFNSMDTEAWINSQTITAFAIDPQTARTVLASNVDYHYFKRYGAMLGSAFMSGYASAISNAGATTSTGIFGTTTTHPELSPASKLAVGLGQVGTTLGTATANYINTPPTVKVNAGVALGILFMSDVTINAAGSSAGMGSGASGGGTAAGGAPAGAAGGAGGGGGLAGGGGANTAATPQFSGTLPK
jgi:polyhydroxyalkanoate synthesis regulator phasin